MLIGYLIDYAGRVGTSVRVRVSVCEYVTACVRCRVLRESAAWLALTETLACESVLAWELSWVGAEHQVFPVFLFLSLFFCFCFVWACICTQVYRHSAILISAERHRSLARGERHTQRETPCYWCCDAGKASALRNGIQACWDVGHGIHLTWIDCVIRHELLSFWSFWQSRIAGWCSMDPSHVSCFRRSHYSCVNFYGGERKLQHFWK